EIKSYEAVLSPKEITPFSSEFTTGINRYGFDVLLDLYDGENIAVSPASLELALLMTAMGATGATKDEMLSSLQMTGLSDEEILSSVSQLMWRTNNNGMETANSLWLQDDFGFAEKYLGICTGDFMADLYAVDYISDAEGATERINDWADEKTHGKIPKILNDELSEMTRLVLVNALYFLGDWVSPFTAEDTYDATFHGAKRDSEVPFMHALWHIRYYEGTSFQLIILPFIGDDEQNGPFAMSFILPKEGSTPEDAAKELSSIGFESAVSQASDAKVRISLPKFEFDYGTSVVETMKRLGMIEAFSGQAQFDEMTGGNNDLFVSDIVHKTYVRVDEEGAEAAAVTAVVMDLAAMPIEDPEEVIDFNADRPFLFAIYDTTDNTVLFTGVTADLS
ncbi:MAG: hypothetical protein JW780_05980, partial [Clostridiales bacterium]|nr:hypothetical protein [Clostridiales bacterium]